jgi:signal transduction histidine kinase
MFATFLGSGLGLACREKRAGALGGGHRLAGRFRLQRSGDPVPPAAPSRGGDNGFGITRSGEPAFAVAVDARGRQRRYGRHVRTWRLLSGRASGLSSSRLDVFLAVVVTVGLVGYTWADPGASPAGAVGTLLAAVMGAGILWRRIAPVACGITITGAGGLYELLVQQAGVVLLAPVLLAFYSIGAYAPLPRAAVGLAVGSALTFLGYVNDSRSPSDWLENVVFGGLVAGSVWAGGVVVRVNRSRAAQLADLAGQLEREREEKARLAVAAERARIARELHDVVAHGISVIAVQAGSGRHTLNADPERAHAAFGAIESTARQALVEMRHLLGLLREENEPATSAPLPGMDRHGELIEQARGAGLSVNVHLDGEPRALPPGIDLAAYRILQEALTNARKHAPGAQVAVRIRFGARDFEIEVRDHGADAGARRATIEGGGHGLIGMRERVALYRGELNAGPGPEGGFHVHARLPLNEGSS